MKPGKFDHLLKYMEPQKDPFLENIESNPDQEINGPALQSEMISSFTQNRNTEPSIFKKIFNVFILFIGIGLFAVILLGVGLSYTFGVAPLETLMSTFYATITFGLILWLFSPLTTILIIIGLFMDSTPPAWIGILVLLPALPFMLAKAGGELAKGLIKKLFS